MKNIFILIIAFFVIKAVFHNSGNRSINTIDNLRNTPNHTVPLIEKTNQQVKPTEGFKRLTLDKGVQIDVPLQWKPLPGELASSIRTAAHAHIANEGLDTGSNGSRLLVAYTSRPTTTYAAVRVKEIVPTSISPAELFAANETEVAGVAQEWVRTMSEPMAKLNQDIQPGTTTTRELVSGHPALVLRYRRLGGKGGPVAVELIRIMTPGREIVVTLSYREAEGALWKPIIENIRRSISIPA